MKGALQGKLDYLPEIFDRTESTARANLEVRATVMSFVVHVPGPEIIGQEADERPLEEAKLKCPPGAKSWWAIQFRRLFNICEELRSRKAKLRRKLRPRSATYTTRV